MSMSVEQCCFNLVRYFDWSFAVWDKTDFLVLEWSATAFVHVVAIIMTAIMIYHIRSKYTAVGQWYRVCQVTSILIQHIRRSKRDRHLLLAIRRHRTSRFTTRYGHHSFIQRFVSMVCSGLYWTSSRRILLSPDQRLRRFPICWRWNPFVIMGLS